VGILVSALDLEMLQTLIRNRSHAAPFRGTGGTALLSGSRYLFDRPPCRRLAGMGTEPDLVLPVAAQAYADIAETEPIEK